jgi:hypothetical protein
MQNQVFVTCMSQTWKGKFHGNRINRIFHGFDVMLIFHCTRARQYRQYIPQGIAFLSTRE